MVVTRNAVDGHLLSGMALSWRTYGEPASRGRSWYELVSSRPGWNRWAHLGKTKRIPETRWQAAVLRSTRPMNGEDPMLIPPPYRYVLWGTSDPFWVVLAASRRVVDSLVRPLMKGIPDLDLTGVDVDVKRIAEILSEPDEERRRSSPLQKAWVLTSVHAKTPSFRKTLESVSYYGEALHRASLYLGNLSSIEPTTVGVRPTDERSEIATISKRGSFAVAGSQQFRNVDAFLQQLLKGGLVSARDSGGL